MIRVAEHVFGITGMSIIWLLVVGPMSALPTVSQFFWMIAATVIIRMSAYLCIEADKRKREMA